MPIFAWRHNIIITRTDRLNDIWRWVRTKLIRPIFAESASFSQIANNMARLIRVSWKAWFSFAMALIIRNFKYKLKLEQKIYLLMITIRKEHKKKIEIESKNSLSLCANLVDFCMKTTFVKNHDNEPYRFKKKQRKK